ncbi:3-methyladenine DNA glycosylase [Macrococcus sp. IME1552]|nr:DNA-3-methyladenine glycosylase I [Macrococcus sp. IME1552]ATD31204.1 3-methyladenine DNA glycosylase [Macrococcus sp. IME1552]
MRFSWADSHPLMTEYYDNEWGIPSHDDTYLFEMLVLEGMQAGLSWLTTLKRREGMRAALDQFDYQKIAKYEADDFDRLMTSDAMIKNKLKIGSIINNAQKFVEIQQEFGSFDRYIWSFTDFKPVITYFEEESLVPADNALSQQISKELKKRGFKFVGPVIIYGFLGAIGIIQDRLR